ncbi:MAG: hypothetical protein A3D35_00225 [Candidatus Staskawiczbacteria bacterium RIFCSPHIGHO2_02_FULL_34_9]|uniref:HD domain-containing protein n=1 Tax=Candidatus Staskawiczbacteria bacterium RIFCSPHIGHO2_02_FULL_34_9 TaxID=1802206 RepID=A0A1G2I4I0_9BACT|nr:MAG: hypothetical protein A3D35_00225 [Candidatus Staskawiczbacteria bacterium RIFCSPHIGHO2_02_FULL_34_9]
MKDSIRRYVQETYPDQYACLVAGKLVGDWENAANHCIIQPVAIEYLMYSMGFDPTITRQLAKAATCHDWDKRLQKRPSDFTTAEIFCAQQAFALAEVNPGLMAATTPLFLVRFQQGNATLLEMIQFLVDDMTMGEEIVHFDLRIDEVSVRNPHPNDEIEKQLGRPYWTVEREVCNAIDCMLRSILGSKGIIGISVNTLINDKIAERFPE